MVFISLWIISFYAFGQSEAVKGNTKVIVNNALSAKNNYSLVVKTLLENGFFIENQDTTNLYIKTQPQKLEKFNETYFLNILTKDNQIVISGMQKGDISLTLYGVTTNSSFETITFKRMKKSWYMRGFEALRAIALKFNSQLSYQ